jgi:hypothetical protein
MPLLFFHEFMDIFEAGMDLGGTAHWDLDGIDGGRRARHLWWQLLQLLVDNYCYSVINVWCSPRPKPVKLEGETHQISPLSWRDIWALQVCLTITRYSESRRETAKSTSRLVLDVRYINVPVLLLPLNNIPNSHRDIPKRSMKCLNSTRCEVGR